MQAVVAEEPKPTLDIAEDPEADADYSASHDEWSIGISRAGGRLCRWFVKQGAPYDFCPAKPANED